MFKKETVNFSKFFPETANYFVVKGEGKDADNFWVDLKIGDGDTTVNFYLNDYFEKQSIQYLKALRDAIDKALEFNDKMLSKKEVAAKPAKATATKKKATTTK